MQGLLGLQPRVTTGKRTIVHSVLFFGTRKRHELRGAVVIDYSYSFYTLTIRIFCPLCTQLSTRISVPLFRVLPVLGMDEDDGRTKVSRLLQSSASKHGRCRLTPKAPYLIGQQCYIYSHSHSKCNLLIISVSSPLQSQRLCNKTKSIHRVLDPLLRTLARPVARFAINPNQ